jgi:hypothetical protein
MPEYIEREAFIENVRAKYCKQCKNFNKLRCRACYVNDILNELKETPAADVPENDVGNMNEKDEGFK